MLTKEEKIRYARMIALPEIGEQGMARLRESTVAVIGCGALGSVCAMYLAGAGIGRLIICDFDTIDVSNLQRQLFYNTADTGKSKAGVLADRIKALNPECEVDVHEMLASGDEAEKIINEADFVVDATDNPESKYQTDRICNALAKGYCIGGISGFAGQTMSWLPGHIRYSDIFPPSASSDSVLPCSLAGVSGPTAGVIACTQASETIKHLSGCGKMLLDRVFTIDMLSMQTSVLEVI